ncbi:DUF535 family protein [Labrys neptuniae]
MWVLKHLEPSDAKKKLRLFLHTLQSPIGIQAWFVRLHDLCAHAHVKTVPFELASKPVHKFLNNKLRSAQRSSILASHYDILLDVFGQAAVHELLAGRDFLLSTFAGRSGCLYELRLERSTAWLRREGELTCRLLAADCRTTIAMVSFAVGSASPGGRVCLWIGGFQGCARQDAKAFTIQVTRDLLGLRPKDLLMHVVYTLKDNLGGTDVKATSNAGHVSSKAHRKKKWSADYDLYWTERGGAADGPYIFDLPVHQHLRTVEDVAPAKRRAWRARHALIHRIVDDIATFHPARTASQT